MLDGSALVVHALWSPGRGLLLWGEDGQRPATTGRAPLRSAAPHPFALPAAELAGLHPGRPAFATLLLPSRRSGPLASPELGRRDAGRSAPTLRPWAVPALLVDPAELADPATGLGHANGDRPVRYGATVDHLRTVVALAEDLAARGRVLPTLVTAGAVDGSAAARWRPVVQGLDAATVEALVAALPPVGRAEPTGPRDAAGTDPHALVRDALAVLVDAAVRDRLGRAGSGSALLVPVHGPARPSTAMQPWLAALVGHDARLVAPAATLELLAEALPGWDAVGTEPAGQARLELRLTEVPTLHDPAGPGPDPLDQTGDGTRWRLELHLRSVADPSLVLAATEIWAGRADRLLAGPQDLLLAELGRAVRVWPPLAAALRETRPDGVDLATGGAHGFLTEGAAALLAAGFGVVLPREWDGSRRLGLRLSVRSTPVETAVVRGGLGRAELAAFEWSMAVGDDELGADEIAELVAAKAPLVRLRGRWVSVDAEALRRGLEFLRRARDTPRAPSLAEVLALASPGDMADGPPLPVTGVSADGWLGDLLAGTAEHTLAPVPTPPGFTATLRPYQQRGLAWLAFLASLRLGACLADDMGLGKTVQLLALEAHERAGDRTEPTLLLCPMSLLGTWEREAARFAPELRVLVHHGPHRADAAGLRAAVTQVDLVVTTYATAVRDADALAGFAWRRLVLDEAQAVKNSRAGAARAVRRFDAAHRVALTGTPVENRLGELWSIMDVLNPGLLGSAERFRNRYAVPIERHRDAEVAQRLRRVTRPYLLRRVKTDPTVIDDLPDKIEITQHYRLTREQASLYRTVVEDMMERIEGTDGVARRGNVLAAMTKLKQVCNHPAQLLHDGSAVGRRSGKVTRLEELVEEILASGDRALCFTQYTEFGHLLVPHLSARFDREIAFLHGGVSRRAREQLVRRFQSGDGPSLLLLSLRAGGTGLTLTAATHVLHLDRWWNPAVEDQATDRAYRIGQRRNVQVRRFVCPGTVEERVDAMITRKRALAEQVVGAGEDWLTGLSSTALRELFALDDTAAGGEDDTAAGGADDTAAGGADDTAAGGEEDTAAVSAEEPDEVAPGA